MKLIKVLAGALFLAYCFTHRSHKTVYPCIGCTNYVDLPDDLCADCYARYSVDSIN